MRPSRGRVADGVAHEVAEGARKLVAAAARPRRHRRCRARPRAGPSTGPSPRRRAPASAARSRSARRRSGLCSLSSADSVSRSTTRRCMFFACSRHELQEAIALPRVRAPCRCIVSTKPLITVSGVLSSCDTLAMKSRRMRATASSSRDVARHQHLLVERERHELERERRARIASRRHDDRVAVVAGVEVMEELGLPHEIDDRLAHVVVEVEPELRERTRIRPLDAVVPRRARRCRRESPRPPAGSARSCASDRAGTRCASRTRLCIAANAGAQTPRPSGTWRVERSRRPVGELLEVVQVKTDDRNRADSQHDAARHPATGDDPGHERPEREQARRERAPAGRSASSQQRTALRAARFGALRAAGRPAGAHAPRGTASR